MIRALYDEISITPRCGLLVYIFIMIIWRYLYDDFYDDMDI